jgi:CMP-N,N'-diacetyllegionaminic acid synthase
MIAIITARGGSKSLPRKNVLPFCGKPLIAHTIEAAKNSSAIDQIFVSTDDEEIAGISQEFGAEVPYMRPAELATDSASSRDVILHALLFFEAQGRPVDAFCLLQPTSPLRTAVDINGAFSVFHEKRADSVLSVTPYDHPIQWAVEIRDNGILQPREQGKATRRQELVEYYRPNGAVYMFQTDFFKNSVGYFGPHSYGYIMPPERSVDIDTPLDFVAAETVFKYLHESQTRIIGDDEVNTPSV